LTCNYQTTTDPVEHKTGRTPMQLNFQIPDKVVEELDRFVDGIRFRNRAQLITVILADWLARMAHPVDPFGKAFGVYNTSDPDEIHRPEREEYKWKVLGDKAPQWKEQGVDLLDGGFYDSGRQDPVLPMLGITRAQFDILRGELMCDLQDSIGPMVEEYLKKREGSGEED
jgi:hypothetical protein